MTEDRQHSNLARLDNSLPQEEAWTRAIVESAVDGIITVDETGLMIYVNPAARALFGYESEQLLGRNVSCLMPAPHDAEHDGYLSRYIKTGKRKIIGVGREVVGRRKDGSTFPLHIAVSEVITDESRIFTGIIHDISEEHRAREEKDRLVADLKRRVDELKCLYRTGELVRTSELDGPLFERVVETVHEAVGGREVTGTRITFDDRAYTSVAFEETANVVAADIVSEERRRGEIEIFVRTAAKSDRETRLLKEHCELLTGVAAILGATTERKEAEAKVVHASTLASIGELAAGVGHEISNPVNGIMNCADILLKAVGDNAKDREFVEMIRSESERIAMIVRNLLTFSRQDKQEHSPARLCDIIEVVLSLCRKKLSQSRIELRVDVPETLPKLWCRSEQLQQVVMNLIINAMHALNERYPGIDSAKFVSLTGTVLPKKSVLRLTVEDHGSGISAAHLERIFDPFFTTKGRDVGTGLGLSVSAGIVKDHGGVIWAESEPGNYTRFHVDLPLDRQESDRLEARHGAS